MNRETKKKIFLIDHKLEIIYDNYSILSDEETYQRLSEIYDLLQEVKEEIGD